MLRAIIKVGKNLLLSLILAAMIISHCPTNSFADYSENEIRPVDVVIRAGEWGNKDQVKPGKRYEWGNDINISKHGISIKDIPQDIPLRCENNQWFISEFDINLKLSRAIAKRLDYYGVDVNLQYTASKTGDLNAAGKTAARCNPKLYLSVHHNSYNDDSTGYFFMYNQGDVKSKQVAHDLSESIKNNGKVPQRENRANDGYIGELNKVANNNRISVLGEFGYFNKAEIIKICSDEYNNYIADCIAKEIVNQLQAIDKSVMHIVQSNVEEIKVVFSDIDNRINIENKITNETKDIVVLKFK